MNKDRVDRSIQVATNGSYRVFDIYEDKIILTGRADFVEARTDEKTNEIIELIMEDGP